MSQRTPTQAETSSRDAQQRDFADVDQKLRHFAIEAGRLLADSHCEEVLVLDVSGMSQLTDYILIASGTSDRQMRSVAHDVADLGREYGLKRFGSESDEAQTWIVVDFGDVMVHLFEPATRAHYDLEMMWGDAPRLPWRRQTADRR